MNWYQRSYLSSSSPIQCRHTLVREITTIPWWLVNDTDNIIYPQSFLDTLRDIFRTADERSDGNALIDLFDIAAGMILLGNTCLIEKMLSDAYYLDIFGMLEYDTGIR